MMVITTQTGNTMTRIVHLTWLPLKELGDYLEESPRAGWLYARYRLRQAGGEFDGKLNTKVGKQALITALQSFDDSAIDYPGCAAVEAEAEAEAKVVTPEVVILPTSKKEFLGRELDQILGDRADDFRREFHETRGTQIGPDTLLARIGIKGWAAARRCVANFPR